MVDRGRLDYCKDLSFVDPRIIFNAPSDKMELLSPDYEPGDWDVICQGGKDNYDHGKYLLLMMQPSSLLLHNVLTLHTSW
jgi:hypothetical protein